MRGPRQRPAGEHGALRRAAHPNSIAAGAHAPDPDAAPAVGGLPDPDLDGGGPERELSWSRTGIVPASLIASRPEAFTPGPGIRLPVEVHGWLSRYPRPPVLSFVDPTGWPAATRVAATMGRDRILLDRTVAWTEGAPVSLTFHQLTGNYRSNDAFLVRGHLDEVGTLVPEQVVGYGGTSDDRGVGSVKLLRLLLVDLRRDLKRKLEQEGRPVPSVRPPTKRTQQS